MVFYMKHVTYDRHAKRRMKERSVSEEETEFALNNPDLVVPSIKGRTNSYKFIHGRYLRITWKEETDQRLVITVTIRKKSFKE